jgi:hypothetical protein
MTCSSPNNVCSDHEVFSQFSPTKMIRLPRIGPSIKASGEHPALNPAGCHHFIWALRLLGMHATCAPLRNKNPINNNKSLQMVLPDLTSDSQGWQC